MTTDKARGVPAVKAGVKVPARLERNGRAGGGARLTPAHALARCVAPAALGVGRARPALVVDAAVVAHAGVPTRAEGVTRARLRRVLQSILAIDHYRRHHFATLDRQTINYPTYIESFPPTPPLNVSAPKHQRTVSLPTRQELLSAHQRHRESPTQAPQVSSSIQGHDANDQSMPIQLVGED